MKNGNLYLIPAIIAEGTQYTVIPAGTVEVLKSLKVFLAEDIRTARRYFSSLKVFSSIEELSFSVLNKDTTQAELVLMMEPLLRGEHIGVVSESGCPGVADPGALAVAYAHLKKIRVVPLTGPSSILLALMASGLNGQHFSFNGYLPIESTQASRVIQELEKESTAGNRTQIFIETPYRNNSLLANLLLHLHPGTKLCIALDITSDSEDIRTMTVREWKTQKVILPKMPAIFLFLA